MALVAAATAIAWSGPRTRSLLPVLHEAPPAARGTRVSGAALDALVSPELRALTDLERTAATVLEPHAKTLGRGHELIARAPVAGGDTIWVHVDHRWQGLPVEGSRGDLRFRDGRLVLVRLAFARDIDLDPAPRISGSRAEAIATHAVRSLGRVPRDDARVDGKKPLVVVRGDDRWHLAWSVELLVERPYGDLTVWIDAHEGTAIGARDRVRSAAVPLLLDGTHEPRRAGDPLAVAPFGPLDVRPSGGTLPIAVTDTAGRVSLDVPAGGASYDLRLEGPYTQVSLFSGTDAAATLLIAGSATAASLSWTDANALLVERDAFVSAQVVRERMKRLAPGLAWYDEQVRYVVEVPDAQGCNAFWDPVSNTASFFRESPDCNATGRVADVVFHETGHGLHQHLSTGGFTAGDVGEGSADYLSATINGDPDIGPSFFKDRPEGIRNLEPDLRYPDDRTGQIHHDGLIWGGAFWDLRTRMIGILGSDAGVRWVDEVFADTLRGDPTLDEGFEDVLFAADDDGNPENGVPRLCEIAEAFGAHGLGPGEGLAITHLPLGAQPRDRTGYVVRAHIFPALRECAPAVLAGSFLEWRVAGTTTWNESPLEGDLVPFWRRAIIPAHPDGTTLEYRLRAQDGEGRTVTAPARNFETIPFAFTVGDAFPVFSDDFEGENDGGWTHQLVEGLDQEGADDWQRGAPTGASGDPTDAFSGGSVWANDLGVGAYNGAYQGGIHNRLSSPSIDCRGATGTRLQFRRWLNVEDAALDQARILVNGTVVWTNPVGETVRDRAWRFEDVDISHLADGQRIRVSFELQSGFGIELGGWTIDDVAIVATGRQPIPDAGCSCDLDRGRGASTQSKLAAALLAAGACMALLARRRRVSVAAPWPTASSAR